MKREGLAIPFLFLTLAIVAYGSANAFPSCWLLALVSLYLGARFLGPAEGQLAVTPLTIAVCAFGAWLVATNLWANPSYTVAAPYQAAFLVGGFTLGRRAGAERARALFVAALAFALSVAAWGIWQWAVQGESRAHAVFVTPAILGVVINFTLLPALILFALGKSARTLALFALVLCAALALTQSRGAWIALGAALALASILIWRSRITPDGKKLLVALAIVASGWVAAWGAGSGIVVGVTGGTQQMTDPVSFANRLQLYDLALNSLSDSSKIAGSGYESFFYLLDSSRPNVPAYLESQTYFVHNDYLQTLLELGIPGLLVLLVLVVLPVAYAWRVASRRAAAPGEMAMLFAVVAALGSMAVHALGDFPFYVPICVLLYGAALGILESIAVKARCAREIRLPAAIAGGTLRRVVVAGAGTIIAWILVLPAAAEGAAEYGLRHWRAGQGREAAWGLETARRLDSRDWRYHWYAGKFWSMQADSKADKAAAALADRALAAGVAANPREVRPLYDRLVLHERLGPLLRDPADTGTLLAWAERIVALAPADPVVRAERDRVVARFGAAKEGAAK